MDNYTKEQRAAYMRAYHNLHKDDPEYKAKKHRYYETQKNKPEYKERRNARNKKWYEEHRTDPKYLEMLRENARRWRSSHPEKVKAYRRRAILTAIHKEKNDGSVKNKG